MSQPMPVTDAAKGRIAAGRSVADVVAISNMTFGRLKTIERANAAMTPAEQHFRYLQHEAVRHARERLERARETLERRGAERDAAVRVRDRELKELDGALRQLNVASQEMSNLQDAIGITLAAIPLAVGLTIGAVPVAIAVGVGAGAASVVNSVTRSGQTDVAGASATMNATGTDAIAGGARYADAVDGLALAGKHAGKLSTGLNVVGLAGAGWEAWNSQGITAKLDGVTAESFRKLDAQIADAGTWVDKTAAQEASSAASAAQHDVNAAEARLKIAQREYLEALALAEGTTWVAPR